MRAVAVLTAAGSGVRLGADRPKAFIDLAGVPLLRRAAATLVAAGVSRIVVAAPEGAQTAAAGTLDGLGIAVDVVTGGATRQASVAAALATLADEAGDAVVLVHDAARPLVPPAVAERVIAAVVAGRPAVVPVVPVRDTVKRVAPDGTRAHEDAARVTETLDRRALRAVQTPQGFALDVLRRAHRAGADRAASEATAATDDAALVEALGEEVWAVEGHDDAMKITTARDLAIATALLEAR